MRASLYGLAVAAWVAPALAAASTPRLVADLRRPEVLAGVFHLAPVETGLDAAAFTGSAGEEQSLDVMWGVQCAGASFVSAAGLIAVSVLLGARGIPSNEALGALQTGTFIGGIVFGVVTLGAIAYIVVALL